MKLMRPLPMVIVAGLSLLILKFGGLLFNNGFVFSGLADAQIIESNAGKLINVFDPISQKFVEVSVDDLTGAVGDNEGGQNASQPEGEGSQSAGDGSTTSGLDTIEQGRDGQLPENEFGKQFDITVRDGENDISLRGRDIVPEEQQTNSSDLILKRVSERRKELDQLQKELALREDLLKAVETRIESRVAELKSIELSIQNYIKAQEEKSSEEVQRLVQMFEGMKASAAAEIFNRLDMDLLTDVAMQMKSKSLSGIMAKMDPALATQLTKNILGKTEANVPKLSSDPSGMNLPKIGAADNPG